MIFRPDCKLESLYPTTDAGSRYRQRRHPRQIKIGEKRWLVHRFVYAGAWLDP